MQIVETYHPLPSIPLSVLELGGGGGGGARICSPTALLVAHLTSHLRSSNDIELYLFGDMISPVSQFFQFQYSSNSSSVLIVLLKFLIFNSYKLIPNSLIGTGPLLNTISNLKGVTSGELLRRAILAKFLAAVQICLPCMPDVTLVVRSLNDNLSFLTH